MLLIVGMSLALISALVCVRRAFKENLLWGAACLIVPLATLVFTLFHWRRTKALFFLQLSGGLVTLAGAVLMLMDPDTRNGLNAAMNHRAEIAALAAIPDADGVPDGVPPAPPLPSWITGLLGPQPKPQPVKAVAATPTPESTPSATPSPAKPVQTAEEKKRKAGELFAFLQNWCAQLQQKRPAPGASPEAIRAFNEEYRQYDAKLSEYKAAVEALKTSGK